MRTSNNYSFTKVKRRNPLEAENKYCVISFNTENHDNHKKMLKSSVEGKRERNLSETAYVITDEKSVHLNLFVPRTITVKVDYIWPYGLRGHN
jgi:hypothetical protein